MTTRIPLAERNSPWRGAIDLARRAYPGFVFGTGVDPAILPVFHFHEVTADYLEPHLAYLRENGYRTVNADAVARFVRDGVHPGEKTVALTFDDAWASAWTVATPLLRRYDSIATLFVAPGRVPLDDVMRPMLGDAGGPPADVDRSAVPFATWPELRAMQGTGLWDIQSHSFAHAKIFCASSLAGFVTPEYRTHIHDAPNVGTATKPVFLNADHLGAPLHALRSRMSDALRYDDTEARLACEALVKSGGGASFFEAPDWGKKLRKAMRGKRGKMETREEREAAIRADLEAARETLQSKLKINSVRHICFPWAVAGKSAEALAQEVGYESAYADTLGALHAARSGANPFRIMRLKHKYIFALPGRRRRSWWNVLRKH
ncbi:MAG: polysaccharide deacetylase family protein [Kiritimatiellae bacterium]|nr:polysaccharide deacetylase family protein [Kiritimatiellia bacterium]